MDALVTPGIMNGLATVGMATAAIVLAAALAAYLDVRMRRRRKFRVSDWFSRFLFPYLLPALLLAGFAAYSFSTFVIIPYYPGSASVCHLHDPVCRARINPAANQVYSMIGLATAAVLALIYLIVVAWRRISSRTISPY